MKIRTHTIEKRLKGDNVDMMDGQRQITEDQTEDNSGRAEKRGRAEVKESWLK